MPLPDNFSPWQHLHEMLVNAHNRNVEQTFLNVPSDDLSSPFSGMKLACLMDADDTVDMTILRMSLFYWVFQSQLPTPMYAIPVDDFDQLIIYKPQLHLHFEEPWSTAHLESKLRPVRARIGIRLMHETSAIISPSKAQNLAVKIKDYLELDQGLRGREVRQKLSTATEQTAMISGCSLSAKGKA